MKSEKEVIFVKRFPAKETSWRGALPFGKYTYRLRAIDEDGESGRWSAPIPFFVTPPPPRLLVPPDKSTVLNRSRSPIQLKWSETEGVEKYLLILTRKAPPVEVKKVIDGNEFSLPPLKAAEYSWQVKPILEDAKKEPEPAWANELAALSPAEILAPSTGAFRREECSRHYCGWKHVSDSKPDIIGEMRTRVLLLSEMHYYFFELIRCLHPQGVEVHILSPTLDSSISRSRFCARYTSCASFQVAENYENLRNEINTYCERQGISGIFPCDFYASSFVATVRKQLNRPCVPIASVDTLSILNDKWKFQEFFGSEIPFPKSVRVSNLRELENALLSFPVMAKRLDDGGYGSDATKIDSLEEMNKSLGEKRFAFPFLLQEFIPGQDFDVSVFVHKGKIVAWTIQEWLINRGLRFYEDETSLRLIERIVLRLQFQGLAHFDLRRDQRNGSVYVLECNPRVWGSIRMSMKRGINFPYLATLAALGKEVEFSQKQYRPGSCYYYLQGPKFWKRVFSNQLPLRQALEPTILRFWDNLNDPVPYVRSKCSSLSRKILRIWK